MVGGEKADGIGGPAIRAGYERSGTTSHTDLTPPKSIQKICAVLATTFQISTSLVCRVHKRPISKRKGVVCFQVRDGWSYMGQDSGLVTIVVGRAGR